MGWASGLGANAALADVVTHWTSLGDKAGPRAIRTLADQVQDGDFMWTRDTDSTFWLGRVGGPWLVYTSEGAFRYDLENVRPCDWLQADPSLKDYDVPGAVVRSFTGPGPTIRRVKSTVAANVTEMIWEAPARPRAPAQLGRHLPAFRG